MLKQIIKLFLDALALILVSYILPSLQISDYVTALIAVLVIALVNMFIKPIVHILTLPINIVTLGLFTLLINAAMFALAAYFVDGFEIANLLTAVLGSILFSIFSFAFATLLNVNSD